jgi:NAD dependent epimerase/dehydratase family enzyme
VAIAFTVQKPLWLPNVPSFLLRGALGEMSVVVLGGNWADPQKIIDTGFMFEHLVLRDAVVDLLT